MENPNTNESLEAPAQPQEQTIEPKSPVWKNKWLKIGIGAIIFLILLGSGSYFLNQKTQKQVVTAPTPTPVDETANWKTFDSANRSYTFKYPPEWDVFADGVNESAVIAPKDVIKTVRKQHEIGPAGGSTYLTLQISTYTTPLTDEELLSNDVKQVVKKEITIDNIVANQYIATYTQDIPGINKGEIITSTIFQHNDKTYAIDLLKNEYKDIYDQILATFKFTDSSDETANWKTVENKNFSIRIPLDWYLESTTDNYIRVQNYNPEGAPGRGYDPIQDKGWFALQIGKLDKKADNNTELKEVIKQLDAESISAGFSITPTTDTSISVNGLTAIKRASKENPEEPPMVYLLDEKGGVYFFTPSLDVLAGKDQFIA